MHGKEKAPVGNPSSTLVAFKPRQVILAEQSRKPPSSSPSSSSSKPTLMAVADVKKQQHGKKLAPEQNTLLLHSVLRYVQANNFSKSLKRLLKDAQIQGDSWKAGSFELEDIYSKFLENCSHVDTKLGNHKEREMLDDGQEPHGVAAASQETVSKKKKRKSSEKDDTDTESRMKLEKQKDKKMDPPSKAPPSSVCDSEVAKSCKKQKKKNKDTLSESLDQDAIQSDTKSGLAEQVKDDNVEVDFKETAKSKDKKKKNKPSTEAVEDKNINESKNSSTLADVKSNNEMMREESEVKPKEKRKKAEQEKKSLVTSENGVDEYNGTKKRKRLATHETGSQPVEESAPEETKRRKVEGVEEGKNLVQNGVEKSGRRKQQNGSAEPKTVNAFQRVKIDEVEFVDERLQDNSYWAKDGAEIGYGAKAQEVLGQVRGRDFRHEKTKKKRGSYRGGQIDLQSHSIKFNYSDEE